MCSCAHACVFVCMVSKGEGTEEKGNNTKNRREKNLDTSMSHYLFAGARCQHYKHLIKAKKKKVFGSMREQARMK